jgi:4'-phosphopantetheinyl transferase EntD
MVSGCALHHNSAMTWRELPPLATDVAARLPELPEIRLVGGRVADYAGELLPEERPAAERAVAKRVQEFATGRHLARLALADLGLTPCAIPRAPDRRPQWPTAVVGSITHAGELAVAAVARADTLDGLGIDLEEADRVTDALYPKLFTAAELVGLEVGEPGLAGLLFSAKEAGYKAVNPRVGKFISFHEAEVLVDWPAGTFRLQYVGDHAPNRIMERGIGHFCFFERYVLTVFMIPRER